LKNDNHNKRKLLKQRK